MAGYEVTLTVSADSAGDLVKVVDILTRPLAGLALDGYHAILSVDPDECVCDDEEGDLSGA